MKTCHNIMSILGLLTLIAASNGGEQQSLPTSVVGPEWKPVEESLVLPGGIKANATYHFNRNALSAVCIADDGLLALTDSGNLLHFDLKDLRLQQETRPDAAIKFLAAAKGIGVLAACADGRVFRIDPKTLKQTEFAKLSAAPTWMTGFHDAAKDKNGVLAAIVTSGDDIELHLLGSEQPSSEKHKVPFSLSRTGISTFFLDRKARLWLGKDGGEWGGWCGSIDVHAGKASKVESLKDSHPDGVYGFVELPDGQIWAYGGMMHLGLTTGFIARVDRGKLEQLGHYGRIPESKPDAPPKLPRYPITHIIPDPKGDDLLVFAYSDLFRVDTKLTNWKHLGTIEIRYRSGRPDAMGTYPALRKVIPVGDKSGDLICTTARDGLLRIKEGQVTRYIVPGQIGDDWIDTIIPASDTSLVVGSGLWRYTGGSWQTTSLYPPGQPGDYEKWYEHSLMLDPDRRPVALCRSNTTPGAWALTRLKDGKVEILAHERGRAATFSARGGFATPDGSFWCADREKLLRLVEGKWQKGGEAPDSAIWGLRALGQGSPPWILFGEEKLYRLNPGKASDDATLTPIPLPAELGKVNDAVVFKTGQILMACTAGLRLFDEKSGKVSECPFELPKGEVRALCRDGRGRTWLAGSSIWMVDAKGNVHDLGKLNRFGITPQTIGADSTDPAGVIISLGERGVLFVRAEDSNR
jgi:streptogramin lyase